MRISLDVTDYSVPRGDDTSTLAVRLARIARAADEGGLDTVWVADHLIQATPGSAPDSEMLEAYTTLAFLAAQTERVRLGTMVTNASLRPAALLIKTVTTLDVLSEGRAWLGIGAGYHEEEAEAMGFDLPPVADRYERLEETLQLAAQMWAGDTSAFAGKHLRLQRPIGNPQPLTAPRPPILIGGMGEQKTLRLVARYADACNLGDIPDGGRTVTHKLGVLAGHCEAIGRPYEEIEKTISTRLEQWRERGAFQRALCRPRGARNRARRRAHCRPLARGGRRDARRLRARRAAARGPTLGARNAEGRRRRARRRRPSSESLSGVAAAGELRGQTGFDLCPASFMIGGTSGSDTKLCQPCSSQSKITQTRSSSAGSRKTSAPLDPCSLRFSAPAFEKTAMNLSKSKTTKSSNRTCIARGDPARGVRRGRLRDEMPDEYNVPLPAVNGRPARPPERPRPRRTPTGVSPGWSSGVVTTIEQATARRRRRRARDPRLRVRRRVHPDAAARAAPG